MIDDSLNNQELKFDSQAVRDTNRIFLKSKDNYLKWKESIEGIKNYTSLSSTSSIDISTALNQIDTTLEEMEKEKEQLIFDITNFESMEHLNDSIVTNLMNRLMLVGGSFQSDDRVETHNGVKIDDFSIFTDMSPDDFFEYMRANDGNYGVNQGCINNMIPIDYKIENRCNEVLL